MPMASDSNSRGKFNEGWGFFPESETKVLFVVHLLGSVDTSLAHTVNLLGRGEGGTLSHRGLCKLEVS